MKLTFNDVLIEPQFSTIKSRKNVSLEQNNQGFTLGLPIISANMDTVTGPSMANTMYKHGAVGCLHRFCSIEDNVKMYKKTPKFTICSFGLGEKEQERVDKLVEAGCIVFCLDVAHGAQMSVVEQTKWFKSKYPGLFLIVGNFASANSFVEFCYQLESRKYTPDYIKVGVGNGSACSTRIKTGVGFPQISALQEIVPEARKRHIKVISDGGVKTPGDIAKALAAGAWAVMSGSMFAGTEESPPVVKHRDFIKEIDRTQGSFAFIPKTEFTYRGSASKESYEDQNKLEGWRTAEGESFKVKYKGSVKDVLKDIEGGLRSSLTYVGAKNLDEFREKAKFIQISNAGYVEGTVHGIDK